jgi:hypothetical protein
MKIEGGKITEQLTVDECNSQNRARKANISVSAATNVVGNLLPIARYLPSCTSVLSLRRTFVESFTYLNNLPIRICLYCQEKEAKFCSSKQRIVKQLSDSVGQIRNSR